MNTALQDTLLQLFQKVTNDPNSMPPMPVNGWQEGSSEWQLLTSFHTMLERIQQRMQEALKSEEAQYRGIFEVSRDGIFIADLSGFPVEANPAACKMFGYSYDEFIGLDPITFIHPDSLHLMAEHVQATRAGNQYQSRGVVIRKDGTSFLADAHTTPFLYKGKPHILAVIRDVTEQVQAEEQLREKEAQYHSVFEASTDGLVINDLEDGHLVEINPAMYRMHGYTYEEFMALHPTQFIHPDSLPLFVEYIETVKAGRQFQSRAVDIRKDGTPFPVEVHGTTFTYRGKPHVLAIVRDVTEQVLAEQELREKEAQYRSIFEASTDGLIINDLVDLEVGRVVEVNPAACKMYGYSYEEFIGLPLSAIVPPDRLSFVMEKALPTIKGGREYHVRGVFNLRKDGTAFPIDLHETAFNYQRKLHMLSVVRDITKQVQAEQQLLEREAQYRSIFEATTDGLFICDLEDGHVVEANPAACNIYGYSYEEFIGLPPSAFIHPERLPIFMEKALPVIRAGGKRHTQGVNLRKDGSAFPVDLHQTAFTYQGKRHMLVVVRDITEQVQAQQLLEHRVEERTRELSTLLEISHNVASTIELKPLLGLVLNQLKVVADYTGSSFSIVEGEDLVLVDNRGPAPLEQVLQLHLPIKRMGLIWEMFCRQEPVIIADVHDDTPLAQAFQAWMSERMETTFSYIRAWMGIPLMLKEQVIGMLTLSSHEPNYYTPQHARMAMAIANQAAVAIENARLYEQAQELAAVEERQRLARELHDSVSQALYGISLGAHTARTLLDRDPSRVADPLNYVLSLAEAALAEMRALIFELRPESLATEGLVSALTKQAAALQARHGVEVHTELCDEPDVPLKVKQELYRVAQEALHNTSKHAYASKVELRLSRMPEAIVLEICDNGVGFDPAGSFPGHLGLHSMRERIVNLGGTLHIESTPGEGTRIRAQIVTLER